MRRMVGRRIVDDEALKLAYRVTVKLRFFSETYYSEEPIDVAIVDGVLTIRLKDKNKSFNWNQWRSITNEIVPSKVVR